MASSSSESTNDSFVVKLLNYFVTVELLLIKKLSSEALADNSGVFSTWDPNLVKLVLTNGSAAATSNGRPPRRSKVDLTKIPSCRMVNAGFSHVLVIRPKSGTLYSFGSTHFGVLGHGFGPSLITSLPASAQLQHSAPKQVEFFAQLNRDNLEADEPDEICSKVSRQESDEEDSAAARSAISVLAVAAGKTHSMALTDCGLYVWGSSKYGQLGLGKEKLVRRRL